MPAMSAVGASVAIKPDTEAGGGFVGLLSEPMMAIEGLGVVVL